MLDNLKEKLRNFNTGRYGMDDFGKFIIIAALVIFVLSLLWSGLITLSVAILIYGYFRMLSRNSYKRSQENEAYLQLRGRVRGWFGGKKQRFAQRREYVFFKCPSCKNGLRVPRGKGKIAVTCPKCGEHFIKRS